MSGAIQSLSAADVMGMSMPQSPSPDIKTPAEKGARDFESVFLSQMLSHMFDGVGEDSLAGGENSQEVYRSWLTEQYGKLIADHGGIGIASAVKSELLRQQEMMTSPVAVNAPVVTSNP